jgi:gliding motility-associated-like protein
LPNGVIATGSGVYTSVLKTLAGCDSTIITTLNLLPAPILTVTNPPTVCSPAVIDLTTSRITSGSSEGLRFTYWKDATSTRLLVNPNAVTATGTYFIRATNADGCSAIKPVTVTETDMPALQFNNPPAICIGGTVDLTNESITAGTTSGLVFTYWSDSSATIPLVNPKAVASGGTYYIEATNAGGCNIIRPVTVTMTSEPSLEITNPAPACIPATIDLTAASIIAGSDPGLTYSYWQDASGILSLSNPDAVTTGGTYYIKASALGGCFTIQPVIASFKELPTASFNGDGTICPGMNTSLTISLTGADPWMLTYSDGSNTHTIQITTKTYELTVSPASTTTYNILSVSNANCSNNNPASTATVTVRAPIEGIRYPNVDAFAFVPVKLSARVLGSNYSYNWDPAVGLDLPNIPDPLFTSGVSTQYYITLTSDSGCVTIDTVLVIIKNPSDTGLAPNLFVPNAWTPDNDGMNDRLYPITYHIRQLRYFRVFDRWGQLVFETNILGNGWDGLYHGAPQVVDVYTWTVEAVGDDGSVIKKSGNAILLR